MATKSKIARPTTYSKLMEADYYAKKDILYLRLLPHHPARLQEVAEDFYACYDAADSETLVGFEIHYLRLLNIQSPIPDIIPYLTMRFELIDSPLKEVPLQEILTWVQNRYILPVRTAHPVMPYVYPPQVAVPSAMAWQVREASEEYKTETDIGTQESDT